MADIKVTIEDAQPINVSLGEAVNIYQGGTGDYNDLDNLPDLTLKADKSDTYTKIEVDTSLAGKAEIVHVHTIADVTGLQTALDGKQPTGDYATNTALTSGLATKADTSSLASVATSGSYNDLSNKPTIPTNNNQLTNGAGYITSASLPDVSNFITASSTNTLTNKSGNISQWTNDSGYLTSHQNISGKEDTSNKKTDLTDNSDTYYPTQKAVKTAVDNLSSTLTGKADDDAVVKLTGNQSVAGVKTFTSSPVVPTPTADMQVATKKYVDDNSGGGGGGTWGSITGTLADQTDLQNALDLKSNSSSLATVATSGDYVDLSNLPTIPAQFNPIAGTNISLSGTYPNITFDATGGGGGGGAWEIVADVTLTSDAPEIAVSGLDLDTDGIYKIEAWNLDSVSDNAIFCVNEETPSITPAGWQYRTIRVEGSVTYVNQNPSLAVNGTVGTFRGTITKVVGGKTFINFDNMRSDGRYSISSQYKTATTNITKIRIAPEARTDMKAGARMVITRLSA